MKKVVILLIFTLLLAGCSTSPYVGTWEKVADDGKVYKLMLSDDGTLVAKWHDGTQYVTRTGTWEEKDGEIILDGINATATAKMTQNKLILNTQQKVRHHFTRKAAQHAHKN